MLHSTLLINKYTGKNKKQFLFYECNLNKMIFKSASAVNYESNALKLTGQKVWESCSLEANIIVNSAT